jgi:hypothetical protein
LIANLRRLGRASGTGCAKLGGVVHKSGKHRVERGRAPKRPGRDQRALDTGHDGFGELSGARATHSEEGELESQFFDNHRERGAAGVRAGAVKTFTKLS